MRRANAVKDAQIERLLAPMRERQVELESAEFPVNRERVLAHLARIDVAPSGARRHSKRIFVAAAATLLLASGALLRRHYSSARATPRLTIESGIASQEIGATSTALAPGAQITASGELATAAGGSARLLTNEGLELELANQSRVELGELSAKQSQLKLLGGSLRCRVPHRSSAHPFRVQSADVTVVDLGTVFTVTLDPHRATRVSVEEGKVLVQHGTEQFELRAPNTWWSSDPPADGASSSLPTEPPASSAREATSGSAPSAGTTTIDGASRASSPAARTTQKVRSSSAPATLARESQLLRAGLLAERQGKLTQASEALDELLTQYPQSPLVPDARAALARVRTGIQRP